MLKNVLLIFLFALISLKNKAQFLDKNFYLVDSIQKKETNKSDLALIDTCLKSYYASKSDTFKLNILTEIIENCNDETIWPRYNRLLYTQAIALAQKEKDPFLKNKYISKKALALNNYAFFIQNYTSDPNASIKLYRSAAKIQEEIGDKRNLVVTNNNIANMLYNNGKILEALDIYQKTIKIQEELKDISGLTPLLNNLGEIYLFVGDTTKAYFYIKRALSTAIQNGDKRLIAQELQNAGVLARNRRQYAYALTCLKRALTIREQIGDLNGVSKSKVGIAVQYMLLNNYSLAKKYLDETEPLVAKTDNLSVQQSYHSALAQYFSAIHEPKKAISEFEKAISISQKTNSLQEEFKVSSVLINLYKLQNEGEKELKLYRRLNEISKKINGTEVRRNALRKDYEFEYSKKEQDYKIEQALKDEKTKDEKRKQKFITLGISFILVLTLLFSFFIFKAFKLSKQKNVIISEQKQEVEEQKYLIEEKQKEIVDSINYAKRIQTTLLANEKVLTRNLPEHFILFKPKDIVSGDFYWANEVITEQATLFFLAVCDSTGHGVPGAFMSLLNTNFLNEAINEKHIYEPNQVLNYARKRLINSISQEDQKDGFDGILLCINRSNNTVTYAAANNAPILINTNNQVVKLPFDKMPVGKGEKNMDFDLYTIEHQKGDSLYLYTDGYADQFGGPDGKKYKYKPLNDLLVSINDVPLNKRQQILDQKFLEWKGLLEQVDDVCIVGIKL